MSKPLVVWSDPPSQQHHVSRLKYAPFVRVLHERPGQWACLKRSETRSVVTIIRNGLENAAYQRLARPYRLQLSVRRTEGGDFGLWARLTPSEASK